MRPDLDLDRYAVDVREELREMLGNLDWRSRGAFQRNCERARPAVDAKRAVAALGDLFPVEEVRKIVEAGDLRRVLPLFIDGWTDCHAVLLHLGDDLSWCKGWGDHTQLVKRLRQTAEKEGARFEVGLWAGAAREGLPVRYVDPLAGGGCDIVITDGTTDVHVEAKSVGIAKLERNRAHLDMLIGFCISPYLARFDDAFHLIVIPTRELIDGAQTDQPDVFEQRAVTFFRALNDWCRCALSPLAIDLAADVPGAGQVRLLRPSGRNAGFTVEMVGIPQVELDKNVARALRPAKTAAR